MYYVPKEKGVMRFCDIVYFNGTLLHLQKEKRKTGPYWQNKFGVLSRITHFCVSEFYAPNIFQMVNFDATVTNGSSYVWHNI